MGWLERQLAAAGGQRLNRRVEAVNELAQHDVVVNCTGVGGQGASGRLGSKPLQTGAACNGSSIGC